MPRDASIKKVLVIGSGPIIIGQAAEFDYAGTQACRALREEGIEVVLINSNPATIMTDPESADRVYIEPLNVDFATRIIARERPDGLLATLGGQTGLNLATKLAQAGVLEQYNVRLLGTPLRAIQQAEDREEFRSLMRAIGEPVPHSVIVTSLADLEAAAQSEVWPLIVRPAYTLGGTGGGVAQTPDELMQIGARGLSLSMTTQVMIEQSLLGWKEVEYEVMRDANDTCITICNMENFDPMGVHTGDSIVVAPSQTLSDKEYQMLRTASLNIIRSLGIEGGCNVQLALDPLSFQYYVIEVNPRVSRSSALASKATGYPIARVASKIAIGLHLDEIENRVTKKTLACFEPSLDYCVVKIPRWPFDKFDLADRRITTQMKATGEVMSIDRSFPPALMKAIRSLEIGSYGLSARGTSALSDVELEQLITTPNDRRLFVIGEAFRRGMMVEEVQALSHIDKWFLHHVAALVAMEGRLKGAAGALAALSESMASRESAARDAVRTAGESGQGSGTAESVSADSVRESSSGDSGAGESRQESTFLHAPVSESGEAAGSGVPVPASDEGWARVRSLLWEVKRMGFTDRQIAETTGLSESRVRAVRKSLGIVPTYKMVDTCAGEFEAATPYFYSCYDREDEM